MAGISLDAACRQDRGHQVAHRAGEVLLTHQDSAVTGVDDIDRAARSRPVRRGKARTCPIRVSQRPASVRAQVSSALRRMLPSHPISVTTTLTQPVSPASRPLGRPGPGPAAKGAPAGSSPLPYSVVPVGFQNWATVVDLGFLRGPLIFVEEAAKHRPALDPHLGEVSDRVIGHGRTELAAAMGSSAVVVGLVLG